MALYGKSDAASNVSVVVTSTVKATQNTANRDALYGNTTADAFITGVTTGIFGASAGEVQAARDGANTKIVTPGYVLRTVGSGGRAGRVTMETLAAVRLSTDASDDTVLPDYKLRITTQPSGNTANTTAGAQASFTVVGSSKPAGATLAYAWTYANGDTIQAGANVGVTTGATLTVNSAVETANVSYKVTISATGAANVVSSNATLTITT
jgi:hypothetical protein